MLFILDIYNFKRLKYISIFFLLVFLFHRRTDILWVTRSRLLCWPLRQPPDKWVPDLLHKTQTAPLPIPNSNSFQRIHLSSIILRKSLHHIFINYTKIRRTFQKHSHTETLIGRRHFFTVDWVQMLLLKKGGGVIGGR